MIAVDLFAGWGGMTEGAEQAGVKVAWAANHWPLAVEAHALNHPRVRHACQDLRQADWMTLPSYELLLASPACQGHSQASQPKRRKYHDALRSTAWSVVDCADVTEPKAIIVENVLDFKRWRLYPLWRQALEKLGYQLQELDITASWHGVPQRRRRLFVVATRKAIKLDMRRTKKESPIGPHLDRKGERWRLVKNATPRIRERIAKGRDNCGKKFLSQHVSNHPGVPLNEPIRTITTKDQWCLVDGARYRSLTIREIARGMGFPESYAWPDVSRADAIRGLGNAVPPPLARKLIGQVVHAVS